MSTEELVRVLEEHEAALEAGKKQTLDPYQFGLCMFAAKRSKDQQLRDRTAGLVPALAAAPLGEYTRLIDILGRLKRVQTGTTHSMALTLIQSTHTLLDLKCCPVFSVFEHMKKIGVEPSTKTYNFVIHLALRKDSRAKAWALLDEMKQNTNTPPDVWTLNIFINSSKREDEHLQVLQLVKDLKARGVEFDLTTYNSLMKVSVHRREPQRALEIFEQMKEAGHTPDNITFTLVLKACRRVKNGEPLALSMWKDITAKGVDPSIIHYHLLFDVCLTQRDLPKATEVVRLRSPPAWTDYKHHTGSRDEGEGNGIAQILVPPPHY